MAEEKKKNLNVINYNDMIQQATAVMIATDADLNFKHWVPCIVGRAGIGKSQMAVTIASEISRILEMPCEVISFVGSMTKDGDIGGLPVAVYDKELDLTLTDYAIYAKNERILRNEQNGIATVLFLDEINRAEKIVMDEFMELILHRELHKFKLPEHCFIMAACNPEEDDDDYQVNIMNPALKDRMFMYYMDCDIKTWIKWAIESKRIHEAIVNFLTVHQEYLYADKLEGDFSHPTPRGWEMFSDVFNVFIENNGGAISTNNDFLSLVLNAGIAKLGSVCSYAFINFIRDNENPLINEEDVLEGKIKFDDVIENLKQEKNSSIRLFTICNRMIAYMKEKIKKGKWKDSYSKIYSEIIFNKEDIIPKDLVTGLVCEVAQAPDCADLNAHLKVNPNYRDNYIRLNMQFSNV